MTHEDDRLPEALRTAALDYNQPPELTRTDLDEMWSAIEAEGVLGVGNSRERLVATRSARWFSPRNVASLAAVLVIGVAIGRLSVRAPAVVQMAESRQAATDSLGLPEPYQSTTSRYLGQTAALLVSLPAEVRAGRADDQFLGRAHDLLLTTRLLLDSPAAADPRNRALFEDLELVLAQIVRLQTDESRADLDLIRQALEQRDVLPRLRNAVADISADD
jgi:hypothetical protein